MGDDNGLFLEVGGMYGLSTKKRRTQTESGLLLCCCHVKLMEIYKFQTFAILIAAPIIRLRSN